MSDHFKQEVAVVTNPAIDRDREREQFSLCVLAGQRPQPGAPARMWQLDSPLLGSHEGLPWTRIGLTADVAADAERAVTGGAELVLLDDRLAAEVDPHLALAMAMRRLRERGLDRDASLALAAGGLRNLHDVVLALGTGAVAVEPYAMWALAGPRALRPAPRARSRRASRRCSRRWAPTSWPATGRPSPRSGCTPTPPASSPARRCCRGAGGRSRSRPSGPARCSGWRPSCGRPRAPSPTAAAATTSSRLRRPRSSASTRSRCGICWTRRRRRCPRAGRPTCRSATMRCRS